MKKTQVDTFERCKSCKHSHGTACEIVPQREIRDDDVPCTAYDGELKRFIIETKTQEK